MKWETRLKWAAIRRRFTEADKGAALDWPSCAVGEAFQQLNGEVGEEYLVCDDKGWWLKRNYPVLYTLGNDFGCAVDGDQPGRARNIHRKIQRFIKSVFGFTV